jgi:hypothetical protein
MDGTQAKRHVLFILLPVATFLLLESPRRAEFL